MADPENMGVAVGILFLAGIEPEIHWGYFFTPRLLLLLLLLLLLVFIRTHKWYNKQKVDELKKRKEKTNSVNN